MKNADVTTIDDLKSIMVLEEFKRKVPSNMLLHLEDRQETNLLSAAHLADIYALVHRCSPDNSMKRLNSNVKASLDQSFANRDHKQSYNLSQPQSSPLFCSYCKKEGYNICQCKHPNCKSSGNASSQFTRPMPKYDNHNKPFSHISKGESEEDLFKDFKYRGQVVLSNNGKRHEVNIF